MNLTTVLAACQRVQRTISAVFPALSIHVLTVVLCFPALVSASGQKGERSAPPPRTRAVALPAEVAERLGIRTQTLSEHQRSRETLGLAEVIDIQPLLSLRAQYRAAQAEEAVAGASLGASMHEYERMQTLFRAGAGTSRRQLHEAEARHRIDLTRVAAMKQSLQGLRERTLQQWGHDLTDMALGAESPIFAALTSRRQVLLLATFELLHPAPDSGSAFYVVREVQSQAAQRATAGWPAPSTSSVSQGISFFLCVEAGDLRTGMRLSAWAEQTAQSLKGVEVDEAAIIWEAGLPWVFVESAPGRYVRTPIQGRVRTSSGWLVTAGLEGGARIVVRGGQVLLSAEMRQRIPQED